MFATLKADWAAVQAYVGLHWKQLVAAVLAGKFSSAIIAAVLALVHAVGL